MGTVNMSQTQDVVNKQQHLCKKYTLKVQIYSLPLNVAASLTLAILTLRVHIVICYLYIRYIGFI